MGPQVTDGGATTVPLERLREAGVVGRRGREDGTVCARPQSQEPGSLWG